MEKTASTTSAPPTTASVSALGQECPWGVLRDDIQPILRAWEISFDVMPQRPCEIPCNVIGILDSGQPENAIPRLNGKAKCQGSAGVPADQLRDIEILTPQPKKNIILGKDVNLACLLINNYTANKEMRPLVVEEDTTIFVKPVIID